MADQPSHPGYRYVERGFKPSPIPEQVPAHDPCLTCFRGDTTTGFGLRGTASAVAAWLSTALGFTVEEAVELVEDGVRSRTGHGIDGSRRVGGERGVRDWNYMVCRGCAKRAGITVGLLGEGGLPGYDLSGLDS